MQDIYSVLTGLGISYTRHDHPAVFTCEEAERVGAFRAEGGNTKNLFLRNKNGDRHYLVSIPYEKKVDLKSLKEKLGESKLSFASPERLMAKLGLTPGSVSLLGLANNAEHDVIVVIDTDLWKSDVLCCHPNVNTATLDIAREDMKKFFDACGNEVRFLAI